jgi:hypothetical protein
MPHAAVLTERQRGARALQLIGNRLEAGAGAEGRGRVFEFEPPSDPRVLVERRALVVQ